MLQNLTTDILPCTLLTKPPSLCSLDFCNRLLTSHRRDHYTTPPQTILRRTTRHKNHFKRKWHTSPLCPEPSTVLTTFLRVKAKLFTMVYRIPHDLASFYVTAFSLLFYPDKVTLVFWMFLEHTRHFRSLFWPYPVWDVLPLSYLY